jgi:hypothetical protein
MPRLGQSNLARGGGGRKRRKGSRPETAGNPDVGGTYRAPRPQRTGVFAQNPGVTPVQRAQRRARRRTDRARARLPRPPIATPPILRNPTPKQTREAHRLIAQSITRAVGTGGSARERLERRNALSDQIMRDPAYRRAKRAIRHYTQAEADHAALAMAKLYGARGSKQQRLRAGRRLIREQRVDTVRAGPEHKRVGIGGLASIDLTSLGNTVGTFATTHVGNDARVQGLGHILGKTGSELKLLGEAPVIGGYELGKATVSDVRHGRTPLSSKSELRRFGEGVVNSTVEEIKHPIRAFQQHPLLTVLDFAALGSVGGRVLGATARGLGSAERAGVRGALARTGSTVRSPLAVVNDAGGVGSMIERDFSKDLTRKAGQVIADRGREPLRDAKGKVVTVERAGRKVPVLLAREGSTVRHPLRGEKQALAEGKADVMASRANSVERLVRDQAGKEMRTRGVRGRSAKDLVGMVVEGTITSAKHFRADLEHERDRIAAQLTRPEQYRDRAELDAARARLRVVESALRSPRVMGQAAKIVKAGEAIGRRLNEVEREAIKAGVLHGKRARRSRLAPVAVGHLGGRYFSPEEVAKLGRPDVTKSALKHGAIRHADGRFMANGEVEDFLRSRGRDPETVAYLPHRDMGGRAFHAQFRPGSRPVMDNAGRRTGEAFRRGSTDSSAELIRSQGVRQRVQLAKAQQLDKMVSELGMRHPAVAKAERGEMLSKAESKVVRQGGLFTAQEAHEIAARVEHDTTSGLPVLVTKDGERLIPLRAFAGKLSKDTQRVIREELQGPGAMDSLSSRLLNDRIVTDFADGRTRNVVLAPAATVERLERHLRPAGEIEKFFQWMNRPFRMAVLPQPRWLTGNFVEPYLVRLTTTGSGINVFGLALDMRATTKYLHALDRGTAAERRAAEEIRGHMLGGLFVGRRGASNRRTVAEWMPRGAQVRYGRLVSKLPVVGQMAELTRDLGHVLALPLDQFFRVNRHIESAAQRAALGKHLRMELQQFRSSWLDTVRLSAKAIEEAKRGLVNTPTQARLTAKLHEDLGKYEGYSPKMRAWIQGPTPFLPWALNAARFVYWTMPAHRTVQTALLVKVNDVVSKEWTQEHADVPPGSLKLADKTRKGGFVDFARYTPYGLTGPAVEGDLGGVTGNVAPQFQGAVAALEGKDPFGRDLQFEGQAYGDKPSLGQKAGVAGYSLLEAMVPYLSTARRLREGGGTAYAGSNIVKPSVKPGTSYMSGPRRVFDPFRPTYLHAPSTATTTPSAPVARSSGSAGDRMQSEIDRALNATANDAGGLTDRQQAEIDRAMNAIGIP